MRLTAMRLVNVRGVHLDVTLDAGPVVITGPAGSGKTTVLEAIAAVKENAGAYGMAPRTREFARGAGSAALRWELDEAERALSGQVGAELDMRWDLGDERPRDLVPAGAAAWLRAYSVSPERWKMEYVPASRSLGGGRGALNTSTRLARDPSKYAFVRSYLEEVAREEAAHALDTLRTDGIVVADAVGRPSSRFSEALSVMQPRLRWDGTSRGSEGEAQRTWFIRPAGPRVELAELTQSETMAVLIAAAWARLGLDRSLLLVDSPELHLHPEQHVGFFDALRALMRRGQLVVTTSSPAILRTLGGAKVVVLARSGEA